MNHIDRINLSIEYIETHLDNNLDLSVLAAKSALSKYHFHRIFKALLGEQLKKYVERRRVTRAAHDLVNSNKRIESTMSNRMITGHLMKLIAHVRVRSAFEAVFAVFLFILGPVMLCWRFPDWLWVSVVVIGFVLFCDAALGLIGGHDKLGVFSNWKKLILFIVAGLGGVCLVVVLYIVVLVALSPPI